MKACFASTEILLPAQSVDMEKWAVVACDQYTSQREYWKEVEAYVGAAPSTLQIVFPEVYLEEGDGRIGRIQEAMESYLANKILTEQIQDGFVLVERDLAVGKRLGLVGALDLENYEYKPGSNALVRATEGTIESRIPPRVKIRHGAAVESPHVMVLVDDAKKQLIEALFENRAQYPLLYDTELMQKGGHIIGYAIDKKAAELVNDKLWQMQQESGDFFLAVGDGNHSLATAKTIWNQLKETLTLEEQQNHPARFALVELVNLHSEALVFEPIHRVLFHADGAALLEAFEQYLRNEKLEYTENTNQEAAFTFCFDQKELSINCPDTKNRLAVDLLQTFLDHYLQVHTETEIDYVHGLEAVQELSAKKGNCGVILNSIDKNSLFPAIVAGGVLPRKTFSMGEAYEKRYYMECRKIQ